MKVRLRDGSGIRQYRFVVEDVDRHGTVRIYFRRKGEPKIRLVEPPGTEAFDREYQRAFRGDLSSVVPAGSAGRLAAPAGTMRWLVEQYLSSAAFLDLAPDTRRVRRRILDAICRRAGGLPYAGMEPRHVAMLRDEKAAAPEAANSYVKALRQLFAWSCLPEYGLATRNPARDVSYLKSRNPEGHRAWSDTDVARYEARHLIGTKARLALDLLVYTGVRVSDLVRLGPQMEREGRLCFSETKGRHRTAKPHELPILPPLRASIDAAPTGHLVYLATQGGHPYSPKGFSNWFARRCREASLDPGLTAHGLRKLAAVRLVEAGATEHELMALFGWTSTKQAALYTRKANRARLEAQAAARLLGVQGGNKSVPLSGPVEAGGTPSGKKL